MAQPISPTVPEPMPPAVCPKLRQVREMIAAEAAAKVQDDRGQRQEVAIQKWRLAPAETGNQAFFQLAVDLRSAGLSMADIEATLRQEAGYARHPAERRREIKEHHADASGIVSPTGCLITDLARISVSPVRADPAFWACAD